MDYIRNIGYGKLRTNQPNQGANQELNQGNNGVPNQGNGVPIGNQYNVNANPQNHTNPGQQGQANGQNQGYAYQGPQGTQPQQQDINLPEWKKKLQDMVENFTEFTGKHNSKREVLIDKDTSKPIKWITIYRDDKGILKDTDNLKRNLRKIVKDCHNQLKNHYLQNNIPYPVDIIDNNRYRWDKFMAMSREITNSEDKEITGVQLGFIGNFDPSCCGLFFAEFAMYLEGHYGIGFERNQWSIMPTRFDEQGREILTQQQFFFKRLNDVCYYNFLKERMGRSNKPEEREITLMKDLSGSNTTEEDDL